VFLVAEKFRLAGEFVETESSKKIYCYDVHSIFIEVSYGYYFVGIHRKVIYWVVLFVKISC